MTNDAEDLVKAGMRLLCQLDTFLAESGSGKFDDVSDGGGNKRKLAEACGWADSKKPRMRAGLSRCSAESWEMLRTIPWCPGEDSNLHGFTR